jgi:cysteine synthase
MMKKSIALFCFALCTGVGSAAQAANNGDAFCTQLSSDIAARSALFLKVAGAAPELTDNMPSAPAAVLQRVHDKEIALHNIANEIWSLRTRMAYFDCTQARTFAY